MGLADNLRSVALKVKAALTQPVMDGPGTVFGSLGARTLTLAMATSPKPNAGTLRQWARRNEFLRTAINRRKRQIAQAKWRLVRRDRPNDAPDPAVEKAVKDLFDIVNPKGESLRSLFDQVIEDVLILDAGCIEKEKTLGGDILALYGVNGATIMPDPDWDGSDLTKPRYYQIIVGAKPIPLRNDQLVYIMANPSTHSPVGWSPTETLYHVIRAELFGEQYDFEQLQRYAPQGLLYLGGMTKEQADAFRAYFDAEIAGQDNIAFLGDGGALNAKPPQFIPFKGDTFETRLAYKKWLATKIAAVFEMDLMVFNLSDAIHKSIGKNLMQRTDEGATGLATLVSEFVTREIVWEIDPTRRHKFEFDDLNDRDAMAQAQIDQIRMSTGQTFPNELRARDGLDPVPWGDEPYTASQSQFAGDNPDSGDQGEENDDEPGEEDLGDTEDENTQPGKGSAKSAVPFVAARRTPGDRQSYSIHYTPSWHAKRVESTQRSPSERTPL
jgi:hypothetical protein